MSSKVETELPAVRQVPWSTFVCAAALVAVWLPVLYLVAFVVPRFEALYSNLRDRGELPYLTECLLTFAGGSQALFVVGFLLFLVLLVVADIGVAGRLRRSRNAWQYWAWFAGVVLLGILATAIATIALIMPIMKLSQSI